MGSIALNYKCISVKQDYGMPCTINTLTAEEFGQFNAEMLELGEISSKASASNALAAVFDLEGFTDFCNQLDPQLVLPEFLSDFVGWLFQAIKERFTERKTDTLVRIWGTLPFFGKFTGDGVLFLWNTDLPGGLSAIGNIAISLKEICDDYLSKFRPTISHSLSKVPGRLRVGIARGQVISIGGGRDFVGPCINMASRLQKIGSLSFAVSRRGFKPDECFAESWKDLLVQKKISIRGVGEEESVLVLKKEFNALEDKTAFK